MTTFSRTIGVVNGGGDCPGLNAVIRAVVRKAKLEYGWRVIGVTNGFNGLIWPEQSSELTLESVRGILARGGTILSTMNRINPFAFPVDENGRSVVRDYSSRCIEGMKKSEIEALVVIGGDGTLTIAHELAKIGVKVVGIPRTIDNNLLATEVTFGFDTALHVATDAIDRLQTTAESHHRVMVIEVMGFDSGWIALHSGLAGGANVVLIPDIPFTIETICKSIKSREKQGYPFSQVVVTEGMKLPPRDALGKPFPKTQPGQVGNAIGFAIREYTDKEVRVTVLGHVRWGGSPSPFDRNLATRLGIFAVDPVARGEYDQMVCLPEGRIQSVPLADAIGATRLVDPQSDFVRAARAVGITFGDRP